jgi:hypothetical protein
VRHFHCCSPPGQALPCKPRCQNKTFAISSLWQRHQARLYRKPSAKFLANRKPRQERFVALKRFQALSDDDIKVIEVNLRLDGYRVSFRNVLRRFLNPYFPDRTLVATAAFTGLRRSELRGLQWPRLRGRSLDGQALAVAWVSGTTQVESQPRQCARDSALKRCPHPSPWPWTNLAVCAVIVQ